MSSVKQTEQEFASRFAPSTMRQIHLLRGAALHQFVHLEGVSQTAFSYAVGARDKGSIDVRKDAIASHVFGQVLRNSHYHRRLMKEISEVYLADEYQEYAQTLFRELNNLVEQRNVIAHAVIEQIIGLDGEARHYLRPRHKRLVESAMFVEDLKEFIARARFTYYGMHIFNAAVVGVVPNWIEAQDFENVLLSNFRVPPSNGSPLSKFWK